jgi:hypothetical protein
MNFFRKIVLFCCILVSFLSCSGKNTAHENAMANVLSVDNYFLYLKRYLHQPVPADAEQIIYPWGPSKVYLREIDTTQEYKVLEEFRTAELSDNTVVIAALIMEGSTQIIKMFYMKLFDTIESLGEAWNAHENYNSWRDELLKIPEYLEGTSTYYNMIAWKNDGLIFLIEIFNGDNNSKISIRIMEDDLNLFNLYTGA